jgi:hypothetical protein
MAHFPAAKGSSGHGLFISAFMLASKIICGSKTAMKNRSHGHVITSRVRLHRTTFSHENNIEFRGAEALANKSLAPRESKYSIFFFISWLATFARLSTIGAAVTQ